MRAKVQLIAKRRVYAREFKVELVHLFEGDKYSVMQLSRLYGVSFSLIYRWIYRYSNFNEKDHGVVEMKQRSTTKLKALEQRIKELEQLVGQKQIQIEFLEKMIDLGAEQYGLDIKKNSSTPHSGGSGKTAKG